MLVVIHHNMKKLFLLFSCVIVLSACGTVKTNQNIQLAEASIPPGKFYFKSTTCLHCKTVDTYITENNIQQKVFFVTREINNDSSAVAILKTIGKKCLLSDAELGVPLFWDGTNCYIGDKEVIEYFKTL